MAKIQTSLTEKIKLSSLTNTSETFTEKFGENFQTNLFRCFVSDNSFWIKYYRFLDNDLFSRFHGIVFDLFKNYYNEYGHLPPADTTLSLIKQENIGADYEDFVLNIVQDIYKVSDKTNQLDYYKKTTKNFIKDKRVQEAFVRGIEFYNKKDYDAILNLMQEATKEIDSDKSIGLEFTNAMGVIDEELDLDIIPTPFKGINEILKGGLAKKELMLILGGTSAGKSWMLQTMGAHALMNNFNVVYYTLEMSDISVVKRFGSVILKKDADFVNSDDIVKIKTNMTSKGITGRLFIVEYPTKSCNINTIKNNLTALYNQYSFRPDLILIDYADLMKSTNSYSEKRFELSSIYEELRGLGGELNAGVVTVSQVNRTGYNKKRITVESIAEDFNKTTICDFILSIGRDMEDRIANRGIAFVAKNRRGKDAVEFGMDIQLKIGQITLEESAEEAIDKEGYKKGKESITDDELQDLIQDLT